MKKYVVSALAGCSPAPDMEDAQAEVTNISQPASEKETEIWNEDWITPAIVEVGNYYPGARAEQIIRIHNGSDEQVEYRIYCRQPDNPREDYVKLATFDTNWIEIERELPTLEAKETKEVLVALAIPEDIEIEPEKWEFWLAVSEATDEMIQTEMAIRWLINMR